MAIQSGNEHIIPLLPCPLCGWDAMFVQHQFEMVYTVECTGCGLALGLPSGYSSRTDLSADWNRRVDSNS